MASSGVDTSPKAHKVLDLQRSAGNAAVQRWGFKGWGEDAFEDTTQGSKTASSVGGIGAAGKMALEQAAKWSKESKTSKGSASSVGGIGAAGKTALEQAAKWSKESKTSKTAFEDSSFKNKTEHKGGIIDPADPSIWADEGAVDGELDDRTKSKLRR